MKALLRPRHARIDEAVLARSGELTPTEFRVLCCLYLHRNAKTGLCNPRPREIAAFLGVHRSHVYKAIDGLALKGWTREKTGGNLDLTIPVGGGKPSLPFGRKSVAKSATKSDPKVSRIPLQNDTEIEDESVADFARKVADSATKCSEFRYTHNKEVLNSVLTVNNSDKSVDSDAEKSAPKNSAENVPKNSSESTPKKPDPKGTRLPETFLLTKAMREWAKERAPTVNVVKETEKFVNHFRSKPGAGGRKLNWLLTWRNWILNAEDGRYSSNGTNSGRSGQNQRNDADVLREGADYIRQKYGADGK